jgi:hypothetical protein
LDCSFDFLKTYIESQFSGTMSWANYGVQWEIDHICPLHQADSYDEIIKLCSYKNLRPLKVSLNRRKSKKRTKEAELMCNFLLGRSWKDVS